MVRRRTSGNMLVLIAAFCFIIILLLFFALGYVRLLGSNAEQKTAIEAAALAAARDLSRIVIDTPEFGLIGLSDSAPKDTRTAPDAFCVPVHSINTLIGTARLDYLIGTAMNIPEWKELALIDFNAAKTRADNLQLVLDDAVLRNPAGIAPLPGSVVGTSPRDKDNNVVAVYVSAETAYTQNQIRMTGSSNYVPNSLQLSLGALSTGSSTNIPIPRPSNRDLSINTDPSLNLSNTFPSNDPDPAKPRFYKSYTEYNFSPLLKCVFAGVGDSVRLVDINAWRAAMPSLAYCHRTIVRAEAQQNVMEESTSTNHVIRAVACAQPASVYDPLPKPGALQISFPDGMPEGGTEDITRPTDLYGPVLNNAAKVCDYYKGDSGDYPVTTGSKILPDTTTWPLASDPVKRASSACKLAVYDWLRRAGTKANVSSFIGAQGTPFDAQGADVPWGTAAPPPAPPVSIATIPRGIVHIYRFAPDGVVTYQSKDQQPQKYYVVADGQVFMECFEPITDGVPGFEIGDPPPPAISLGAPISASDGVVEFGSGYDMHIRLYSRRPGVMNGRHAGEPLDNPVVATRPATVKLVDTSSGKASVDSMTISGRGAASKKWWMKTSGPPTPGSLGVPPDIIGRVDFMQSAPGLVNPAASWYEMYDAPGSGVRVTYQQQNGTVSDIRFRRCVAVWSKAAPDVVETGYVGSRFP